MTLERPLFLLLLLALPALWLWLARRGSRACLLLKCGAFVALVVALAGPWAEWSEQRLAVTVVMDASASMPRSARDRGQELLRELVRRASDAELRLVTFAESPRLHSVPRQAEKVAIPQHPGNVMGTDLESALRLTLGTFPERGARRVLLITDGNETRGQALTAALRARERGVAVHTLPAGGAARLPLRVDSLSLPQQVFSGERFTVSLGVNSLRTLSANISLTCQGRQIGAAPVELRAGDNQVDVEARITGSGVSLLEGRAAGEGDERVLFSQAVAVRRPRVLYVAAGETTAHLADTLRRGQMDVETAPSFPLEAQPERWDAVLLDNYPDHRLPSAEHDALEKYVSLGGGLVFIAGQNNARLAEQPRDPLEKLLPVRGDPQPAPEEITAVVLVLDKSASMDGLKIAMAREAGRASLITLRPTDKVGVIAFDSSFRWVVPLGPASDIARITALIGSISADGGTSIYPALAAGFQSIRQENAARKHIILLTDGWSTPGEFARLSQDAAQERITISTVGVGREVNRALLENLAREARGKSYFVENPEMIPQIVSGEVRELSASTIRERPFRPVLARPVEFTDGVDFGRAPRLLGYVKARARPGSETILRTDSGEPLLVRWQYGLGRVVAFLSDAKNRWAAQWLGWNAYGTLWPQLVRDVCRRNRTVRAGVRPGVRQGEAVVYYDVAGDPSGGPARIFRPLERPRVVVAVPGEAPRSLPLEETAPGHYEVTIPDRERGLYRIVSGSAELQLPEAGFYREAEELRVKNVNAALLREVSRVTGGRFHPTVEQLLDPEGTWTSHRRPLWPYWLALALALNFVELAMRKGLFARMTALAGRIRHGPGPAVPTPLSGGEDHAPVDEADYVAQRSNRK